MKLKPTPIDEDTRRQVVSALRHAAWSGRDQVDELHGRGLLRTPKLEAHLRAEAMQFLVNEMRGWTPAEFLRRISKDLQVRVPCVSHVRCPVGTDSPCRSEGIQHHG